MPSYMGEVTRHDQYGWYGRVFLQVEGGSPEYVRGMACLTRFGARWWIRRQARKHAREQRRIAADTWTFEV